MTGIEIFLENLANFGFYNFVMPWILIFALVYGVLSQTKPFGDNKGVQIIIALAAAFLVVGGLYTFIPTDFFTMFFSRFAILLVALLALIILLGFFGIKPSDLAGSDGSPAFKWTMVGILSVVIITMIVFYAFKINLNSSAIGSFFSSSGFLNAIMILILIAIVVVVIVAVTKGGGNGGGD